MLQGFPEEGSTTVIEESGISHPDRRMNTLQRLIWDTVTYPLWQARNEIIQRSKNKYNSIEDECLLERIIWYVEHRHELVDHHDQFLTEIDLMRLSGMRCKTSKMGIPS